MFVLALVDALLDDSLVFAVLDFLDLLVVVDCCHRLILI
jgi:hypothetical protein